MKRRGIIMMLLCCLFYCVTAFATDDITISKAVGIQNISDISFICIENEHYNTVFHIVDKNEINQLYNKLMHLSIKEATDTSDVWGKGVNGLYSIRLYRKDKEATNQLFVFEDKLCTYDWAFPLESHKYGKENEFCKYIEEIEKTKQKYFFDLEQKEFYQNEVFVEEEKLCYQWGKNYFNQYNQLMVPFKELNTALNTQASYDVKTQMVSIRKGEAVPLYGEIVDEVVYVPVRAFAEMGEYYIYWDDELKTALLTKRDTIELWNQRHSYPPQTHIETEDFIVNLPDTITYEINTLDNCFNFYRVDTTKKEYSDYIGYVKKYTDNDKYFDFEQQWNEGKIGNVTSHLLDMIGITSYKTSDDISMMSSSSKYADIEICLGKEELSSDIMDSMYYFFVNGKDIYVFYFEQNNMDITEQQKIISTFQYKK